MKKHKQIQQVEFHTGVNLLGLVVSTCIDITKHKCEIEDIPSEQKLYIEFVGHTNGVPIRRQVAIPYGQIKQINYTPQLDDESSRSAKVA